jgi:sugar phosphate isomerase/epimerase
MRPGHPPLRSFPCRLLSGLLLLPFVPLLSESVQAETPANFKTDHLVAWCIVPFDAKKRSPAERSEMLVRLGLKHCAYDWRQEHVASFEDEIKQYKKHGIDFFAFWGGHEEAYPLFHKHGLQPQIWRTMASPESGSQDEKVAAATKSMAALAGETKAQGLKLGLYNHGGWGGEPGNLVAVCKALHAMGHDHVGIVYNFHHAHHDLDNFAKKFAAMKPYLLCVNLNGMEDPNSQDPAQAFQKIRPIGSGTLELGMIGTVIKSGYDGPIGVLGHVTDQDVELILKGNLDGLQQILSQLNP